MDKTYDKERMCMHFTGIARYCVTFTCRLKYGHNFKTACPIFKQSFRVRDQGTFYNLV